MTCDPERPWVACIAVCSNWLVFWTTHALSLMYIYFIQYRQQQWLITLKDFGKLVSHVRLNVRDSRLPPWSTVARTSGVRLPNDDFRPDSVIPAFQFRRPGRSTRTHVSIHGRILRSVRSRPLQRGAGTALRWTDGRQGRAVWVWTVFRPRRKLVDDPDRRWWSPVVVGVDGGVLPALARSRRGDHVDRSCPGLPAASAAANAAAPDRAVRLQRRRRDGHRRPILRHRQRHRRGCIDCVPGRRTVSRVWTTERRVPITRP